MAEQQAFQPTVERVKISRLKRHPENPRKGNVDVVAESLQAHGQYKPIIVNTLAPLADTIVAGHHTMEAAEQLGWEEISVLWVAVDEDEHKRIMLVDNRASDLGSYENEDLLHLLESLPDLTGTGYDEEALDKLILAVTPDHSEDDGAEHLSGGSVSSYTLVFDNEGQLNDWNAFLRWLRKMDDDRGYSIAARILDFLDERGWGDGGKGSAAEADPE